MFIIICFVQLFVVIYEYIIKYFMATENHLNPTLRDLFDQEKQANFLDFLTQTLEEIKASPGESRGFRYFPPGCIKIISATTKPGERGGVIEIYEPPTKQGADSFAVRDRHEKLYPKDQVAMAAAYENEIFEGENYPPPFHPEFGGRICVTGVKIYESREGTFVTIPILPPTGQRYEKEAKLSGSSMVRGASFPGAGEIVKTSSSKEFTTLGQLQTQHPQERLISHPEQVKTGLWALKFIDKNGRYSQVQNCHIHRDSETGTLDAFIAQKQIVFEDIDNLKPQERLPEDAKRVQSLVDINDLKNTPEGSPLRLKSLLYMGKKITRLVELPEDYRVLFEEQPGGIFYLKKFLITPPLQAFLAHEQKIVQPAVESWEDDIRGKIGELFEKLVAKALGIQKNEEEFKVEIPSLGKLEKILVGQPEEFKQWALGLTGKRGQIGGKPDFVLPDQTFMEVKSGGKMELKPEKRDQLFRMALYKLIRGEDLSKIKFLMLSEKTSVDKTLPQIKYENILDSDIKDKIDKGDLEKIKFWQKKLK